jgi:hypothetical protein
MAEFHTLMTHGLQLLACGLCVCTTTLQAEALNAPTERVETHKPLSLWLNAGFYSAHFDTDKGLRNSNPGFGVEAVINENWSATAGTFTNSDDARSNYLGAYYQPWHWGACKAGAVMGGFNGYPKAFDGGWFPALLPVATWEGERFGLNIALVPPLQNRLYGAISFQLKVKLP